MHEKNENPIVLVINSFQGTCCFHKEIFIRNREKFWYSSVFNSFSFENDDIWATLSFRPFLP